MIGPFIIYMMGVSGSGKTTIGAKLSELTGIPFFDGDDFHPPANKEKMKAGKPLDDKDRVGWLQALHRLALEWATKGGAIIACSALKESYRASLSENISVPVRWVFLQGDYNLINQRINARKDHFMPTSLLRSQFDILEIPHQAITINIANNPDEIVKEILHKLNMTNG